MSATNRGAVRREADFYETPPESVEALLRSYKAIEYGDKILEPSAGSGAIIQVLRSLGYDNDIDAVEIRPEETVNLYRSGATDVFIEDYLKFSKRKYDLIIGNPPYSLAQEFIDKSLELLTPGGRLVFLLRTNFLESEKRFNWWSDKIPSGLYVLHKRPSFTGKGTDATSYSWFIWDRWLQTDRQTDNKDYLREAIS